MAMITGNTFPVKDKLRAMGGTWNPRLKGWEVPEDKADAALALVNGSSTPSMGRKSKNCKTCGCKINYGVYCGKCEYSY